MSKLQLAVQMFREGWQAAPIVAEPVTPRGPREFGLNMLLRSKHIWRLWLSVTGCSQLVALAYITTSLMGYYICVNTLPKLEALHARPDVEA